MRAWLLLSTIAFIAITAGDATEADNGDNCSSIAFIFKAYTASPSLVERLALAQQQFTACGGYFRVIYTFQDLVNGTQEDQAAAAARAAADVGALRAALGREAVIGLGPADYAVVFGTEWARLKEHEGLSGKWPKNFLWTHCDAPELAWFDMFSRDLPLTVKHVWTAEWDVGWTGSLPGILLTFPRDADYICFAHRTYGIRPRPNWTWAETRSWLDQGEIRRCAVFLTRWSWALLTAFRGETRLGHMQYCEASGASICAKHNLWCSIDTFNESSPLIGKTRAGKALFAFNTKIHESTWRRIEHDARIQGFTQERPGQLYHKLRFDE
ncbi:hypothetical protein HYH03_014531 [Edaphochlamys debaryana]|uniref:Uncharacterized protein n=1 Tax=Edaphochlamys debaryana TaxID=47281 RepID=A0A835XPZ8_9CHLO|nr:hypothetical protein HYH03_014531 [Edaphochlamys debaryana]|eukprot:KAG2486848.1 hypothetical protein HYH03_014531 [Edaphochlamys debaryana]